MPLLEATKIKLSDIEKKYLDTIAKSRIEPAGVVQRAKIILYADMKIANNEIARLLGISNKTVKLWRDRWADLSPDLNKYHTEKEKHLKIDDILSDKERPGCPSRITAEQNARILSLACENPKDLGLPISHWTIQELVNEIKRQKIVEEISWTRVQSFLKNGGIKTA
jgi:transposase